MWKLFNKFISPKNFYYFSERCFLYLTIPCVILLFAGIFSGLWIAPADYQQGDGFRIIYVHAPSAFIAMGIYMAMAFSALLSLVWRTKISAIWMCVSAPIGAWFSFLTLFTGSIWGKPMWGTWWIWDARLTSALILFFLYLGFLALQSSIRDRNTADRACAVLTLVGVINIPIIHYSVNWWNTLHQGATISRFQKPAIDPSMLYPLIFMITGFFLFYLVVGFLSMRCEILERERKTQWVQDLVREKLTGKVK